MKKIIFPMLIIILACSSKAQPVPYAPEKTDKKMNTLLSLIRYAYVEPVDLAPIVEKGMIEMLAQLDPHSTYISEKDVKAANEPLQGNFDGIGVSFQIIKDTIQIIEVISGGPSEKLGLQPGDKIVTIDEKKATGDSATSKFVYDNLRGKKGTTVVVEIVRKGYPNTIIYKIVRDKIPLNSVDTWFMEDATTGYIRLDRFSRTTMDEIRNALTELKKQGMKNLIFDLRGNGGGYLDVAVDLADEFLDNDKLVVYVQGQAQNRRDHVAKKQGLFEKGKLVILIDEGSASASEIVSGAVQDWDRGVLVGRRSFGKGLVQQPFNMPDGSEVRLTIARYYTPSGRCIQKPYSDGLASYYADVMDRYKHGEMIHPDSIKLPDSLKYETHNKRVVYGGGGIMPDIFTPLDTIRVSDYFIDLRRNNILNNFVNEMVDGQREELLKKYPTFEAFYLNYGKDGEMMKAFTAYAEEKGVKRNVVRPETVDHLMSRLLQEIKKDTTLLNSSTYEDYVANAFKDNTKIHNYLLEQATKEDMQQSQSATVSDKYIESNVKGLIARNLYGIKYYYQILKDVDEGYLRALEVIDNDKLFKKLGIKY